MRLTDSLITNQNYRGEPTTDDEGKTQWPLCIIWDDEIQGFGVRIFPPVRGRPSRKDFIVTWKIGLKNRMMAIGTYGVDCTLRQARRAAKEAIDLARRGQDPIEARQRALGIGTNEDLASRFLFEHTAAKKKPAASPATDQAPDPGGAVEPGAPATDGAPAADSATPQVDAAVPAAPLATPATDAVESTAIEPAGPSLAPLEVAASATPPPLESEMEESAVEAQSPEVATLGLEDAPAPAEPAPPDERLAAGRAEHEEVRTLAAGPKVDDTRRKLVSPPPPVPKRGPTKVRLLPVPDALYRTIEHGARESGMTIAAYLNALIEIARAAVGDDASPLTTEDASAPHSDAGPSIKDLFAQVQEAQAVEVDQPSFADRGSDRGESSD